MTLQNQTPLLHALIPFILGIEWAVYDPAPDTIYVLLASLPFLLWLLLQRSFPYKFVTHSNRWTTGLCVYITALCFGYVLTQLQSDRNSQQHFGNLNEGTAFIGIVTEAPIEKEKSYKTTLQIKAVLKDEQYIATKGNCLTYFAKDSLAKKIQYGDEIIFTAAPITVTPPANPAQFNYKQYLSYRNIYHRVYLHATDWKPLGKHKANTFIDAALRLRERMLAIFRNNKLEGQDYAVLSALTLGDADEINQETMDAFATSGTIHILSVSGMHVAIIFFAFEKLLFFMNRRQSLKIIKSILLLLLLGSYAVLTGLSPPVLRSAAMLGLLVLGSAIGRQPVSMNIVSASAMALLFYNPFYLMDVGFQLSFLAIIGIVVLNQSIFNWVNARYWIARYFGGIISMSLAAQLATLPLLLLYFHQFPTYFLLANLILVPLSTFIIYGGMILLLCSTWSWLALLISKTIAGMLYILFGTLRWIEQLPYALINKISISLTETLLLYLIILSIILLFAGKQKRFIFSGIAMLCILLCIQITETFEQRRQRQLVIFSAPKSTAISFIDGRKNYFLADAALLKDKKSMSFNIRPYWWQQGLEDETVLPNTDTFEVNKSSLYINNGFIQFQDKRIALVNAESNIRNLNNKKLKVDLVILSHNPRLTIQELQTIFEAKEIIFDSSNSIYRCKQWEEDCNSMGIKCHSVLKEGAYIASI